MSKELLICQNCLEEIDSEEIFCANCGQKIHINPLHVESALCHQMIQSEMVNSLFFPVKMNRSTIHIITYLLFVIGLGIIMSMMVVIMFDYR